MWFSKEYWNFWFLYFFIGLSNHCKLEIVQCDQSSAQKVKIALQIEGGGRVIGEYSSEDTLDKIIDKAKDKLQGTVSDGHEPVIIYMRQEIIGLELLSKTTLKGWIDFTPYFSQYTYVIWEENSEILDFRFFFCTIGLLKLIFFYDLTTF